MARPTGASRINGPDRRVDSAWGYCDPEPGSVHTGPATCTPPGGQIHEETWEEIGVREAKARAEAAGAMDQPAASVEGVPPKKPAGQEPVGPTSLLMGLVTEITGKPSPPHQRIPALLYEGDIPGLMEWTRPGLWTTFTVLWHFADRQRHIVTASTVTLLRKMGISDDGTLAARIKLLKLGDKRTGFPAILRRTKRIEFSAKGLRQLVSIAAANAAKEKDRVKAISRARAEAGLRGAEARWRDSFRGAHGGQRPGRKGR